MGQQAEAVVPESGTSEGHGSKLWSDEMNEQDMQSSMCATLSVDATTVPTISVDPVSSEVLPQVAGGRVA